MYTDHTQHQPVPSSSSQPSVCADEDDLYLSLQDITGDDQGELSDMQTDDDLQ